MAYHIQKWYNIPINYKHIKTFQEKHKGDNVMKLIFNGAAHEVTGSCHCLDVCNKHILIDYGMQQGRDIYENDDLPWPESDIDYVLLTHAHIDHSGLIPLLFAKGFHGLIYATQATTDLCEIMLRDSAHIQEFETEWRNRKARRSGKAEITPLYTMADAMGVMSLFKGIPYNKEFNLCEGIRIKFVDQGHLLGSASIQVWVTESNTTKKLLFSGDVGNTDQPLIRDPQYVDHANYVIMESTYGDRLHEKSIDYVPALAKILQRTFDQGGNVVIPSFAVGRTQEMLYFLRDIKNHHLVKGHDHFDVYVDSPLAIEATNIFQENETACYDNDTMKLVNKGINPITFPNLHLTITSDESKAINFDSKPKVIISASGMCDAGRIRHHLKHNLWRPESTVLFVGYQAVGSLGRTLLEGATEVRLFGETIDVSATIEELPGMSGHADQNGLVDWVTHIDPKPQKVFVIHGEDSVCDDFAHLLQAQHGLDAEAPFSGAIFDLEANQWIKVTQGIPVPSKSKQARDRRSANIFTRLVTAGRRLGTVIQKNKDGANKDLIKFTDQINNLCNKWDR